MSQPPDAKTPECNRTWSYAKDNPRFTKVVPFGVAETPAISFTKELRSGK